MRVLSLNARAARDAQSTDEVEVMLFSFDHDNLDAPLRVSTDPTERISTEPLLYGTRSSWLGADPETEPYLFTVASAGLPDDTEEGGGTIELILSNLSVEIAKTLRSFTDRATVDIAVVLASSPDEIEDELRGLKLIESSGDASDYRLVITRDPVEEESVPTDSFSKARFPGMYA
ncbi:hypothetical protein [Pseudoruegeria sp. HB172150]|uniref:hypothetical protein n=1 Tax=Pseudoruegeria sp. HB172150 TaxID=2721164 RepID=UPI0015570916|nr:hypothetical protein [Pseudoruegeria sp. HB172150]